MIDSSCLLRQRVIVGAAALLALLVCSPALAREKYGPDDEAEVLKALQPQAEPEVPLPAFPKAKDLIPIDAGPVAKQAYAIDAASLAVTPDDMVRYTVVATSSSGAKNISHEAISCRSFDFRRYAYGTAHGEWVRARTSKWIPISSRSQIQLHYNLTQFFFCRGRLVAGSKDDILRRLKENRPLSSD